jgi:hypothetical protein
MLRLVVLPSMAQLVEVEERQDRIKVLSHRGFAQVNIFCEFCSLLANSMLYLCVVSFKRSESPYSEVCNSTLGKMKDSSSTFSLYQLAKFL